MTGFVPRCSLGVEGKSLHSGKTVFSSAWEIEALLTGQVSRQEGAEVVYLRSGKIALWDGNKYLIALLEENEGVFIFGKFYVCVPGCTALGTGGLELDGVIVDVEGTAFS